MRGLSGVVELLNLDDAPAGPGCLGKKATPQEIPRVDIDGCCHQLMFISELSFMRLLLEPRFVTAVI